MRQYGRITFTAFICIFVLAAFVWVLVTPSPPQLDDQTVAMVNGEHISSEEYFQALATLFIQQMGASTTVQQRQKVLDDLIDEHLMLQRTEELGLVGSRQNRLRQLRERVILAGAEEPDEEQMRRFYEDHPELFLKQKSYHVQSAWFFGENSKVRAEFAVRALNEGADFSTVQKLADPPVAKVPDGPMPSSTLRHYVGPSAVDALESLRPGEWSKPLAVAGGHLVLVVVDVATEGRSPLQEVRQTVQRLCRRQLDGDLTEQYVKNLRLQADIIDNQALLALDGADLRYHLEREYSQTKE